MPQQAILFVHHANDMYGADIGLLHSVKSLDRGSYYPIVILPSDMPTGMLSTELDRLGVEYHIAPLGILRRKYFSARSIVPLVVELFRGVAYVRATARSRGVAMVYVNTIVAVSGAIGGKLAGVPVLWHIREILSVARPIRWALHRALGLCADRIVCISGAVRDSLLKEAPYLVAKAVLLYDAISVAASNGKGQDLKFREELGVPQGAPLVGMVGRITHWKGQEILAEAAGLLRQSHPDAHFVAVGGYFADESHYLHKLQSLIKNLGLNGNFHLADYRSNVTDVYRALDIFVLPSRKPEPFGLVTVEAMTQGRAVIATNHGGTCELIQEGVTGMLVPPSDPKALVKAIELLLADRALRETMGRAAAKYARENFGLAHHGEQLRSIIDQLVTPQQMPQTILFVHHANDMYGADIGLLHSVKSLDREKYYPIVILPSDMPTGMLSTELDRLGIEYHIAPLGILRRKYFSARSIIPLAVEFFRGVAYVRATARCRGAVLVYVNTIVAASGAIGGKLARVPVLWHVREILSIARPVRWVLHKTLSFCADRVVCISQAVRDSLLKETPQLAGKSIVVYNAVSVAASNGKVKDVPLREELGVPPGAPLVGMVGRITHWKGQEILAEAAGLVARSRPDVHFVAVGSYFADESYYLHNLQSLIDSLGLNGRFHIANYRPNVTDVYRALDIFVLPSRKPEPFGRVTVEAMMQGRAVIATNHGGTCELIEEGVTGTLVPPSDPNALVTAIERLLNDRTLGEKMGHAAAMYARENFSMPRYQDRMRNVIDHLVAAKVGDLTQSQYEVHR